MTDPAEIARIARVLTEAQKASLQYARAEGIHYNLAVEPETSGEVRTADALTRKGCLAIGSHGYRYWLTPLGIAVRNHLKGQTDANKR